MPDKGGEWVELRVIVDGIWGGFGRRLVVRSRGRGVGGRYRLIVIVYR